MEADQTKNNKPTTVDEDAQDIEATGEILIPIQTIDGQVEVLSDSIVPQVLADDPIAGDGSAGRSGVEVSPWRLHVLAQDPLDNIAEPSGDDRRSRRVRRAHERSRVAREGSQRQLRKRWRVAVAFLLVAAVLSVGAIGVTYALEMWGGKTIPYVMGSTQINAERLLKDKGFVVSTKTELSDTVEGHVVNIAPSQGKRVEEGSKVVLTVGKNRVVPDVVGKDRDEARKDLKAVGADQIRFEERITVGEKGKVLEVRPAAGSPFMSTEEVVLVVSELPVVPDLIGQEEVVALGHLEREGILGHAEYERGSAEQRMRVIRTEPKAGSDVGEDGVTVVVGDTLINPMRLSDYFDANGAKVAKFLEEEEYAPKMAHLTSDGHLVARFENADKSSISFAKQPWSRSVLADKTAYQQVMDDKTHIEGVRLTVPVESQWQEKKTTQKSGSSANTSQNGQGGNTQLVHKDVEAIGIKNPAVGEATANEVMAKCGFEGAIGSCNQDTIVLPKGTSRQTAPFYCCYGEVGKRVWTILIKGTTATGQAPATEIVVTCVPKSSFADTDLKSVGEKVCDYVAYQDIYKG